MRKYGNKISHYLKTIKEYVPDEKWKTFTSEMEQVINDMEEEAFMNGYCYAIQILQDSLKKKTT